MAAEPHYIDVDLKKSTHYKTTTVTQNDTDVVFILRVSDDGRSDESVLDNFSTVTLTSQRRDGQSFYVLGEKIPGTNEVRFALGTKELELTGKVSASAQLYSVDGRQSSAKFNYNVEGDLTGDYVPTETEATLIEMVLMDGPATIAEAEQVTAQTVEALELLETEKTVAFQELDDVKEDNKLTWKPEVATVALRNSTYPNPQNGDTVRITEEARIDRFNGTEWITTDRYNPNALDLVHQQLADTTVKLADTTEGIKETVSTKVLNVNENSENRCVVTFIDDDATTETYTRLLPIFKSKNVPFGSAVITGYVGNAGFMNIPQIKEGRNNGMEILSHTVNHYNLAELSESDVDYELRESKQWLIDNGFENESFVYPQSGYNLMSRKKVKAYYDYAFGDNGFNDKGFLDNSRIKRVAFGSWTGGNTPVNGNTELDTYNYYKECVDYAVSTKSLLVFMIHVKQQPIEQDAILAEIIDYIKSLSVPILKPSDAYREKGNKFAVGDLDEKYLFIGETDTATNLTASIYESINGRTNASPISAFKKGFVTISDVNNADVAGFPDASGYLETYRTISNFEGYSFQIFRPLAASNQKTFRRVWNTATGVWGAWIWLEGEANPVVRLGTNGVTASTLDSVFANNKITYTLVTSAGASGFPRNAGGTLVVDKIVFNTGYRKHLYHIYNTGETWERLVKSDGSYGSWLRQGGSAGTTSQRPVDAFVGYEYFDTTLGKPVWLKATPSTWVDATGTGV